MNKRNLIIAAVLILVVVVGAFFVIQQRNAASATTASLQTAEIQRGALVAAVNAAGSIAAPQSASLNWGTNGTVGKINVTVGAMIKAGDVLMELKPDSVDHTVIQAQADLIAAQQSLDTLMAGATEQQLAQAKLAIIQADQAVTTAQRNLTSVQNPVGPGLLDSVTAAQVAYDTAQANSKLENVGADATAVQTAENSMNLAYSQLQRAQVEYDDCIKISCAERPQRERSLNNAQNAYQTAGNQYGEAKLQFETKMKNLGLDANTAKTNLDAAKASLAAAQAGPDQTKVTLYQAQLDLAKANLQQAKTDLAKLQAPPDSQEVIATRAKIAAAQSIVNSMKLIAPFTGTVVTVSNRVGDTVTASQAAIVIADLSSLETQVDVSEVDINRIAVGQTVNLTADAVPGQTFQGTVASVSILGKVQQGVVTYPILIVVPKPDPALKPGMTAAVAIVTDQHKDVLLVPNRAIRVAGGQRTVMVLFEGEQIPVPITLGLSNETLTEVVDGQLKEGDTVLLNATTTTATTNRGPGGFFFGGGGGGFGRGGP